MNPMLRIGGLFALFVTITKVIVALGITLPVVGFVAAQSSFFYGLAAGVIFAGFTRNFWVIIGIIAFVFVVLKYAGF